LVHSRDEAVGHALRFTLALDGVEVHVYQEAGALLSSPVLKACHCLVLHDDPPRTDGCALLELLRQHGALAPAILLVGLLTAALQARAEAAGFWLVLEWPILDNRLIEAILSQVRAQRTQGRPYV
jgi:FixJ family two-component response regulator